MSRTTDKKKQEKKGKRSPARCRDVSPASRTFERKKESKTKRTEYPAHLHQQSFVPRLFKFTRTQREHVALDLVLLSLQLGKENNDVIKEPISLLKTSEIRR